MANHTISGPWATWSNFAAGSKFKPCVGVGPASLQWSLPTWMIMTFIGRGRQWNRRQHPQAEPREVQTADNTSYPCGGAALGQVTSDVGDLHPGFFLKPQLDKVQLPRPCVSTACWEWELEQRSSEVMATSGTVILWHSLVIAYYIKLHVYSVREGRHAQPYGCFLAWWWCVDVRVTGKVFNALPSRY